MKFGSELALDVDAERMYVELDPEIVKDVAGPLEVVDGETPSRAVRGQLLVSKDGDAVFVPEEVVVRARGREEVVPLDGSTPAFSKALAKGWLRGLPGLPSLRAKPLLARPQNRGRESRPQRRAATASSSKSGDDPPDESDKPPGVEPGPTEHSVGRLGVAKPCVECGAMSESGSFDLAIHDCAAGEWLYITFRRPP